jgi:hypothetical protein
MSKLDENETRKILPISKMNEMTRIQFWRKKEEKHFPAHPIP